MQVRENSSKVVKKSVFVNPACLASLDTPWTIRTEPPLEGESVAILRFRLLIPTLPADTYVLMTLVSPIILTTLRFQGIVNSFESVWAEVVPIFGLALLC